MRVEVAKTAGFCFGVQRAVDTVYALTDENKGPVYTFGPIIHNEQVVQALEERGVKAIYEESELETITEGTIVIRSHGVAKAVHDRMLARETATDGRVKVIDATCPFVKKIHRIVSAASEEGRRIIICGDANHPEVQGIVGWCKEGATVIHLPEEAREIAQKCNEEICVVAQTTFNYNKFKEIVEILGEIGYSRTDSVVNTICNATEERQTEARSLARRCDAMVVIGSQNSSNTRKLYEISKQECEHTYYVQSVEHLDFDVLKSFRCVGITAGASTPRNIIEEVHANMSDMSFEQLLEGTLKTIRNGEVVEGTVIRVKEDELVLNIGYKADGIITKSEYSSKPVADLREVVKEGDTMSAKVVKVNDGEGQVLLSRKKLQGERTSQVLADAMENGTVLTAQVTGVVDGGLNVLVDEVRVFIPASLVSDVFERDLTKYQDQEIEFQIIEYNPRRRRIIGSRKQLVAEQKKAAQEAVFARLQIGDVVEGTVKNVTDFGVFVDIGGVDGLLHVSEISWGRIQNPKKEFKTGDVVTVFVKDIKGDKVALSMKFADQNPWQDAEVRYAPGTVVTGKVARMTTFGAFVELARGVDALLHVSQISHKRVEKPADVLSIGQEIEAVILDFHAEDKKISISMKALEAPAPVEEAVEEVAEEVVEAVDAE